MELYHGSVTPGITELEPRKRYTPGQLGDDDVPPAIYATDDPAYAAAHAFPWGSNEGFDLRYNSGVLNFSVPAQFRQRLQVPVYLYRLPADDFTLLENVNPIGRNYWSVRSITPVGRDDYPTVEAAITQHGGLVRYVS